MEKIIDLFKDKNEILQKVGKYILRVNSKEKYFECLCNEEEENLHLIG